MNKDNKTINIKELVINYFVTRKCNFNCTICYSKWDKSHQDFSDLQAIAKQKQLLDELYEFFKPKQKDNHPLTQYFTWNTVRINFSGGEPFLVKHISLLIQHAYNLGFRVSVTTNGSLLTPEVIQQNAKYLAWLGFSIDSSDDILDIQMGRADKKGRNTSIISIKEKIELIRILNPNIRIKINTTLSVYNFDKDFASMVLMLKPDKWTVVQALPIITKNINISDQQFFAFIERHKQYRPIPETIDDFTESFFLITPDGRFFSNGEAFQEGHYRYSAHIHVIGIEKAFSQIKFDVTKFLTRYQKNQPFLFLN